MPIFEVEQDGVTYEVDAPDIQQAATAAKAFKPPTAAPAPTTAADGGPLGGDDVPVPGIPATQAAPTAPSLWERARDAVAGDPIIDMWVDSLKTVAKGAPEAIGNMGRNALVQGAAGITAPFVANDMDDAANYVKDFTAENSRSAAGPSAQALERGLGEAFEPLGNIKRALGEGALALTDSPAVATAADMIPDLAMTMFGAKSMPKIDTASPTLTRFDPKTPGLETGAGVKSGPSRMLAADELSGGGPNAPIPDDPVNVMVDNLRSADIRMRPSDVRAVTPNKKTKVPGETRERFADGPDLKKDMTLHNQQRFTDMAAEEIGVKALDEASLAKAEAPSAATYDMVENVLRDKPISPEFEKVFREGLDSIKLELPRGKPNTITGVLGAIRRRAAKRLQSENPEMEAKGYADRNMADAIEEGLGNELNAAGEAQLFDEYQAARQNFAKVNDIRTATRAEQVDANTLYKLGKKTGKLSGRLKLIADASEFAPNITKHSTSTAAREGAEMPATFAGAMTDGAKRLIRKIPGMDVSAPSVQNKFGIPDDARAASYARESEVTPLPDPKQGDLDLRAALELDAPPGEVGVALPSFMRKKPLDQQPDMLGSEFEFDAPPGEVGVPPPAQVSLQELLGLGEPLAMKRPPGRVGKPKPRE